MHLNSDPKLVVPLRGRQYLRGQGTGYRVWGKKGTGDGVQRKKRSSFVPVLPCTLNPVPCTLSSPRPCEPGVGALLEFVELAVDAVIDRDQLLVVADLADAALLQPDDQIGVAYRR